MTEISAGAIPALSDDEIEARVGEQSFRRGRQYFRDGSIFEVRQQGNTVRAQCHGSSGGPYRLHVTFGLDGIASAHCSCPVGAGGYCKHVAALLLTWRERPDAFLEVEDLDAALEGRSKEELIALVKQMLKQQPDLESLLEVPLPTGAKRSAPVDIEVYRRQAAAVFSHDEMGWGEPRAVEGELLAISSIGDEFIRQQDYASAAAVYEAVTEETLKHFETYHDESGTMMEVISQCVAGLGASLEHAEDAAGRERILRVLFEVYHFDVNFGGIGLGDEALELLYDQTTKEERASIAGWVREAIPAASGNWSSNWKRGVLGGFLLDLEAETLDDEAFLQVCRETGRVGDLVDRLLSLGRIEEAVQVANQASDYELLSLAGLFERHEQGELAQRLVEERAQTSEDTRLVEWLKDRYKRLGATTTALDLAEKLFRARPEMQRYRELRELAGQAGAWAGLRPQILAFLREQRWNDLLVAIHLEEGEIDQALEALRAVGSRGLGYSYGLYGPQSLAMQVARAATETRPDAALEIYREQVERLIAGRNRGSYADAASLVRQIRDVQVKLGRDEDFAAYLHDLRDRYRTLRSLKEQLTAAGL